MKMTNSLTATAVEVALMTEKTEKAAAVDVYFAHDHLRSYLLVLAAAKSTTPLRSPRRRTRRTKQMDYRRDAPAAI